MMKRYVLIVAGGRGLRMGSDLPKQFIPMEGKPVLMHTLEAFHRWDASAGLILVLPEDHQPYWKMLCREIGCKVPHRIANGGETRFHSVRNGLNFLSDEIGNAAGRDEKILVAVHDGVRPFAAPEVIDRCFAEAEVSGAAIPVVPVVDSLREFSGESSCHLVETTTVNVFVRKVEQHIFIRRNTGFLLQYLRLFRADARQIHDGTFVEIEHIQIFILQAAPLPPTDRTES